MGREAALFTLSDDTPRYGRAVAVERVEIPDYADRLPEAIREFTQYETDGAHGGSHPIWPMSLCAASSKTALPQSTQ